MNRILGIIGRPFRSRKNRVALVTLVVAFAAELGWNISGELLLTILGVGSALILGIAHEDNGSKRTAFVVTPRMEKSPGAANHG
jgi:hypothetical protein